MVVKGYSFSVWPSAAVFRILGEYDLSDLDSQIFLAHDKISFERAFSDFFSSEGIKPSFEYSPDGSIVLICFSFPGDGQLFFYCSIVK